MSTFFTPCGICVIALLETERCTVHSGGAGVMLPLNEAYISTRSIYKPLRFWGSANIMSLSSPFQLHVEQRQTLLPFCKLFAFNCLHFSSYVSCTQQGYWYCA